MSIEIIGTIIFAGGIHPGNSGIYSAVTYYAKFVSR